MRHCNQCDAQPEQRCPTQLVWVTEHDMVAAQPERDESELIPTELHACTAPWHFDGRMRPSFDLHKQSESRRETNADR